MFRSTTALALTILLSTLSSSALTTAHRVRSPNDSDIKGYYTDQVSWKDASGQDRIAELATDTAHPVGPIYEGGHMQSYKYMNGTTQKTCVALSSWGFGSTINHGNFPGSGWGAWLAGAVDAFDDTSTFIFKGAHHAVWLYRNKLSLFGKGTAPYVFVTRQYIFNDGQDQFQYAITFEASHLPADTIEHFEDARSPYNDFNWWATSDNIKNMYSIGTTHRGTINSATQTFDLTTPYNLCPFIIAYKNDAGFDDELGIIQTRLYSKHHCLRASPRNGTSGSFTGPDDFDFQLSGYQGWSGGRTCWNADKPDGQNQPFTTYGTENFSMTSVIGRHSDGAADRCLAENNTQQNSGTTIAASTGSIQTRSTEGVGLLISRDWDKPGFDQVYRTWNVMASNNVVQAALTVQAGQTLKNPTFVAENYTVSALPTVTLDGTTQTDGSGCWISVDTAAHRAWVTLNANFSGSRTVRIAGPADPVGIVLSGVTVSPSQFQIPQSASVTVGVSATGTVSRMELDCKSLGGAVVTMGGSNGMYTHTVSVPANVPDGKRKLVIRAYDSQGRWHETDTFVIARRPDELMYGDGTRSKASTWQTNMTTAEKSGNAYEGTMRMEFAYNGRSDVHGGIEFNDTFDMRPYKFLVFAYKGPTSGQGFSFNLVSSVTTRTSYGYHLPSTTGWTRVILPIRSVIVGSGFTTKSATSIHFWIDSTAASTTGTMDFDGLYLTSWPDDSVQFPTQAVSLPPTTPAKGISLARLQGRSLLLNVPAHASVEILNLQGRRVASFPGSPYTQHTVFRLPAPGAYLTRIVKGKEISIRRIVAR